MANVSRTIDIIFNGKDRLSGSVGKIAGSIRMVSGAIEDIAEPVAEAVDKLIQMETALLAVGAAISTISLAAFKNYEYALIDLKKVLAEDEIPLLEKAQVEIEDMAIQYGKSAVEMIKATTDFRRAGFTLEDSTILLRRSLELSSAGMVDLGEATNDIIAIMKGFRFETEDAVKVITVINKVSDTYATNATELADALRRVAPAAELAGLSIEETTALLTPAIEVFRSGEEAGTAWRRGLIKVGDDAAPVKEALKRLGVQQKDTNGQLRSGRDILYDLIKAMQSASSANQLFAASQIFGNRQASKVITSLRDMNYVMEIEAVAAGAKHSDLMIQVEKRWASFEIQLGASKEAIRLAATALGEDLAPAASNVLGAVTELFSSFRDNLRDGAFDTLFALLENFSERISEYLLDVGKELPKALRDIDYSDLLKAFEGLFHDIAEIIDRFDLDTPEGLRDFLQETIDVATGVINVTTGLVQKFDEFGTKILSIIRNFKELGAEEQKSIGRVGAVLKAIDTLGVKGSLILQEMERSGLNIADAMDKIGGGIETATGAAKVGLTILLEPMLALYRLGNSFTKLLRGDFRGAWDELADHAQSAFGRMISGAEDLSNGLTRLDGNAKSVTRSVDAIGDSAKTMEEKFTRAYGSMGDGLDEFADYVIDEFGNVVLEVGTAAETISRVLEESFQKDRAMIREEVGGLADDLMAQLDLEEDIGEAMDWFHKEAEQLMKDLDEGTPRPFEVDADRKRKWEEYKSTLISTAEETTSRIKQEGIFLDDWQRERDDGRLKSAETAGKKMTTFYGKFTNESLQIFKDVIPGMDEYDRQMTEALDQEDVELDVPDDTKFKAAQAKLLKEIDTNADIMEAKLETFASLAESDAETVSSAFEGISDSITSTSDILTGLYEQMSGGRLDIMTQSKLQRQISSEEERRQEAFDLQKELTTAQIDLIKQRASAMAAGDPIVTVSGDGLQPHLEAFMWEILSAIQVRVNEDYGSFLLGIGAT